MIKIKSFDCGVKLIYQPIKGQVSNVAICVNCGTKDERKGEEGVAHFLEHLFFKSTKTESTKSLATRLESLGSDINAQTDFDCTSYTFKALNENTEKTFKIYCDMFFNGAFKKDEVDKERKVVLEEIKVYEDNSHDKLVETCETIIHDKTPYAHGILGFEKVIKTISIPKIKAFRNRNYIPSNLVVSVVGGVKFSQVVKMVNKYFCSQFEKSEKTITNTIDNIKVKYPQKYLTIQKTDKQIRTAIFYNTVNYSDKDKYKYLLYSIMMGYGMSGRMFQYLREKQGLCYTATAISSHMKQIGDLMFYIGAAPEKLKSCVVGIKYLINEAGEKGFSEEELEKAKIILKADTIFSSGGLRRTIINFKSYINYGKCRSIKEATNLINKISLADVNLIAKTIADDKNFLVGAIGNKIDLKILKLFEK